VKGIRITKQQVLNRLQKEQSLEIAIGNEYWTDPVLKLIEQGTIEITDHFQNDYEVWIIVVRIK
jgi:hypothetical protein